MCSWFVLSTHFPLTPHPMQTSSFLQLFLSITLEMKGIKELTGSLLQMCLQMVQWEGRENQLLALLFASFQFQIFLNIVLNINLSQTLYNPKLILFHDFWHLILLLVLYSCCCSVTKSCPTLCDPINHSTPGSPSFTISQSLLKFMSTEVVMTSNHLILCPFYSPSRGPSSCASG